jgi:hypothetical protein
MKTINKTIITSLIIMFAFLIIGCERVDDTMPKYLGDWVLENDTSKVTLRLDENSFTWTNYEENELGGYYHVFSLFGDLIVKDLRMSFITNNAFLMDTSSMDSLGNGPLTEFIRGTVEFRDRFGLGLISYDFDVVDDDLIFYPNSPSYGMQMIFKREESIP